MKKNIVMKKIMIKKMRQENFEEKKSDGFFYDKKM